MIIKSKIKIRYLNSNINMLEITNNDVSHLEDKECYNLLYFTASWCGPCKRIYPLIDTLSEGLDTDIIDIYKVDIDENEELAEKLHIRSVPTFFLYYQKNYINQCGGSDINKVKDLLTTNIKNKSKENDNE